MSKVSRPLQVYHRNQYVLALKIFCFPFCCDEAIITRPKAALQYLHNPRKSSLTGIPSAQYVRLFVITISHQAQRNNATLQGYNLLLAQEASGHQTEHLTSGLGVTCFTWWKGGDPGGPYLSLGPQWARGRAHCAVCGARQSTGCFNGPRSTALTTMRK